MLTFVNVCTASVWAGKICTFYGMFPFPYYNLTWIPLEANLTDTVMASIGVDTIRVRAALFSSFRTLVDVSAT